MLEVDQWTKEEILFLKIGGNERFTKAIKSYNIPLTKNNQEYKYYTKAAQYYRDILVAESKKSDITQIIKPSLREGIELLYKDEYSNLFNKYSNQQMNDISDNSNQLDTNLNINNEQLNNNIVNNNTTTNNNTLNNNESWVDKIIDKLTPDVDIPSNSNNPIVNNINKGGQFLDNIANNMLYAINDVKERAKDIDIKEKFKLAGEYVQNKTESIQNSDTFKGIMNTVSSGIDTIVRKTDDFFKPDSYKLYMQQMNNKQNIQQQQNVNSNANLNSPYVQNNNQNLNNNGYLNNVINRINEPAFKSNYTSINNDKNDQYSHYINELSDKNNDVNTNNIANK